jgi:hypothetical protein
MNSDSLNFKMVWQILFYYIQAPALRLSAMVSYKFHPEKQYLEASLKYFTLNPAPSCSGTLYFPSSIHWVHFFSHPTRPSPHTHTRHTRTRRRRRPLLPGLTALPLRAGRHPRRLRSAPLRKLHPAAAGPRPRVGIDGKVELGDQQQWRTKEL